MSFWFRGGMGLIFPQCISRSANESKGKILTGIDIERKMWKKPGDRRGPIDESIDLKIAPQKVHVHSG